MRSHGAAAKRAGLPCCGTFQGDQRECSGGLKRGSLGGLTGKTAGEVEGHEGSCTSTEAVAGEHKAPVAAVQLALHQRCHIVLPLRLLRLPRVPAHALIS